MQTERKWIDLRSDTVTQPTQQMREAMFNAQVGDDVYGDDPTMNELEKKAAEMLGKEAALFMASGTMGNAVAVMSHTSRGDEIILSDTAHIVAHEVGGAAVLSQAFVRTLHFENGIFDAEQTRSAIRDRSNIHYPRTGLICVEEPLATGKVVPLDKLQAVYKMAKEEGLPVHMDGARIFNAATALGVDVKEIAACADSVMFCLSKGLCAPVGSMLVGTSRTVATEFAFFLAIPIMFGWSLLKFFKHGFAYTATEWMVFVIGLVVAFVVSIIAIKFLVGFVKKHDFTAFGVYRIIIGAVVLVYFLFIV